MSISILKNRGPSILLLLTGCAFYLAFAYDLDRTDFPKLITLCAGLFFLTWKLIQLETPTFLLVAGILFRGVFFFSIPELSQDYFRFLWDGHLLLNGINPYFSVPNELLESGAPMQHAQHLVDGMGPLSAANPTSYPPLNQVLFAMAAWASEWKVQGGILLMRTSIFCADLGLFFIGRKFLEELGLPPHRIFWYFLNPLVIIELTGNLHFEGVMLLLLLLALWLLFRQKPVRSAFFFASSVALKLLPLIFLPVLLGWLNSFKRGKYLWVTVLVLIAFFSPLVSWPSLHNFFTSVSLWFHTFEFNASIYYLLRWIGFQAAGYNIIGILGPALALVVFLLILGFSWHNLQKQLTWHALLHVLFWIASLYFLLATTVHPWYLCTPLLLSIFTRYRFIRIWSALVFLSYFTYSQPGYRESTLLLLLEYLPVYVMLGFEIGKSKKKGQDSKVHDS